ncbi:DUF3276 family protein [Flammeovirga kamogawensis]|uniref:PUR family DNA/RNA-binding protein n=1 Tax=Flammeovirga kamogawensis TaxID=373891 RepID=A0ABX8GWQ2_9BACT|nr:DUF3276 family protein [Flammeovirga kamogawensis]MBB6460679.1 hypothetical protein [Flammeovirga kamogawensis]QWG08034.1 PUR family DNA/RNA-binding protein [Flammeovirga kamogawensis]TRX69841.1 DUF3276 family protein [Flammeovirga kamogawensis]
MEERREEIFSRKVRAGKRTYFFDVKATRSNDYYLTITESKKRFKDDQPVFEKHKIFLYKEDFEKFVDALGDCVDKVKNDLLPEQQQEEDNYEEKFDDAYKSEPFDNDLSY